MVSLKVFFFSLVSCLVVRINCYWEGELFQDLLNVEIPVLQSNGYHGQVTEDIKRQGGFRLMHNGMLLSKCIEI